MACNTCQVVTFSKDLLLHILNPESVDCGVSTTLIAKGGLQPYTFMLTSAPGGVTITPAGVLTVPIGVKKGTIVVRVVDGAGNIAFATMGVFCVLNPAVCDDPCFLNSNSCNVILRIKGCFPLTITDAKGRTKVVTSYSDYQFLTFG
jgi:hypothetical protein